MPQIAANYAPALSAAAGNAMPPAAVSPPPQAAACGVSGETRVTGPKRAADGAADGTAPSVDPQDQINKRIKLSRSQTYYGFRDQGFVCGQSCFMNCRDGAADLGKTCHGCGRNADDTKLPWFYNQNILVYKSTVACSDCNRWFCEVCLSAASGGGQYVDYHSLFEAPWNAQHPSMNVQLPWVCFHCAGNCPSKKCGANPQRTATSTVGALRSVRAKQKQKPSAESQPPGDWFEVARTNLLHLDAPYRPIRVSHDSVLMAAWHEKKTRLSRGQPRKAYHLSGLCAADSAR